MIEGARDRATVSARCELLGRRGGCKVHAFERHGASVLRSWCNGRAFSPTLQSRVALATMPGARCATMLVARLKGRAPCQGGW